MNIIKAEIHSVHPLTDSIIQVILRPASFTPYQAGQYLQIILDEKAYAFSIANAALGSHKLELHIRHSKNNLDNDNVLQAIKQKGEVSIDYPHGQCTIERFHDDKPIVFIAGGTGFAPIKAVIEQLFADGDKRKMHLFWGAKTVSDLYMEDLVKQWRSHVPHFNYTPVASGLRNLCRVVMMKYASLNDSQIMVSGPFDMVYQARDLLTAQGFDSQYLYSDAFDFE